MRFGREYLHFEESIARKGGGGTNTVTSSSKPPDQFVNAYTQLLGQGQQIGAQPYQPYGGNLVAPFAPDQLAGIQGVQSAQGAAAPYLNSAAQYINRATSPLWPTTQQFSPNAVNQYMSPYVNNVVGATEAQFANTNAQQREGLDSNAIKSGGWGGDRSGVAEGILAGQQATAQAPVIAGLYNQGYGQALGEFNTQQASQLGANEANSWLNSQAGYGMANLGNEALNTSLTGANALLGAGGLEQGQGQSLLNVPYQQYIAGQAYPFQTAGWLQGLETNLGSSAGGTGTTSSPGPSPFSQIAGLGLGAAGTIGATGGFGSGGWLTNLLNGGGGLPSSGDLAALSSQAATNAAGLGSGVSSIPFSQGFIARGGAIPSHAHGGHIPFTQSCQFSKSLPELTGLGGHARGGLVIPFRRRVRGGLVPANDDDGYWPEQRRAGGGGLTSIDLVPGAYAGSPMVPQIRTGSATGGGDPVSDYLTSVAAGASHALPLITSLPAPAATPPPGLGMSGGASPIFAGGGMGPEGAGNFEGAGNVGGGGSSGGGFSMNFGNIPGDIIQGIGGVGGSLLGSAAMPGIGTAIGGYGGSKAGAAVANELGLSTGSLFDFTGGSDSSSGGSSGPPGDTPEIGGGNTNGLIARGGMVPHRRAPGGDVPDDPAFVPGQAPIRRLYDWMAGLHVGRGPEGSLGVWAPGQMPPPDEIPPLAGHGPPPGLPVMESGNEPPAHGFDIAAETAGLRDPTAAPAAAATDGFFDPGAPHARGASPVGGPHGGLAPRIVGAQSDFVPPTAPGEEGAAGGMPQTTPAAGGLAGNADQIASPPGHANPWLALAEAGFGMAAGRSPHALENIGAGAERGLQGWVSADHAAQQLSAQVEETKARLADTAAYREAQTENARNRTDIYGQRVQSMAMLDQARSARLTAQAAMAGASKVTPAELNLQAIKSLVGTPKPDGTAWTLPEATRYMNGFDIKERNAASGEARAAQGDERIQLARDAIALRERDLNRKLTSDEVKQTLQRLNISKDFMGKLGMTEPQAQSAVQGIRDRAGAPAASGIAAPQSKQEFDALPSGTQFTAPDGSIRVKP